MRKGSSQSRILQRAVGVLPGSLSLFEISEQRYCLIFLVGGGNNSLNETAPPYFNLVPWFLVGGLILGSIKSLRWDLRFSKAHTRARPFLSASNLQMKM